MNPLNITSVLTSRTFWIIVILAVLSFVVYRNWNRWISKLTSRDRGNYDGQSAPNAADRARIEAVATEIRSAIYGLPVSSSPVNGDLRDRAAEKVLAMNDTEVRYLAGYYAQIAQGNSLLSDAQSEYTWWGDVKQRLIAKLLQLNIQ